jgi:serine/threonine protein kinase/tetratricopeptide (TPR) repeat protein
MRCSKCKQDNPPGSRFCSGCGAEFELSASLYSDTEFLHVHRLPKIGDIFAARYRIIERAGTGGMGLVFKAEDVRLRRHVALKLLPLELTQDDEAKHRFIQEARAASALDHPNICTVHEIDETEEGQMYIVMAFYGGETLKQRIRRGALAPAKALDIAIQMAAGLARTHEAGIVHRDIKPGNVILTSRGDVKIVDFGLAKLTGAEELGRRGVAVGTLLYMSPEQAQGDDVDRRADLWALGAVLYEMLVGRPPFEGDHDQTIIYSILNSEPEPVGKSLQDLPPGLDAIIARALAKRPIDRYRSADDMLVDLSGLREKIGVKAPAVATVEDDESSGTLMLQASPIAVISFENQTGDATYDYLRTAIPNLLITSLEQSRFLRVVTWERLHDIIKQMGQQDVGVIDKNLGFELCKREGIDSIVLGSFTKAGNVFATDVKVLDVENKTLLKSASARGDGIDSILKTQIDDLSREISRGVGLAEHRIDQSRLPIVDVTTASMEAYDCFLKGRDSYERLYNDEARRQLEAAVEIDSTFAVAYLYLAWTYGRLREVKARDDAYEKARSFSDKATRKERMYIEASYALTKERDLDKRFRILLEMSELYPDEKRVHHLLASHYRVNKQFYQAIEEYNKVLELDPGYGWAMNELAYMYTDVEDFQKAFDYFKRYAAVSPGDANPVDSMGELYFRMGNMDKAVAKYKEALGIKPDFYYAYWELGYVSALRHAYDDALVWIDRFLETAPSSGTRAEGLAWKCFYLFWQGRLERALAVAGVLEQHAASAESELWKAQADKLRGWIHIDRGEYELSRACFERCLESVMTSPADYVPPQLSYSLWTPDRLQEIAAAYVFALGLLDVLEGSLGSAVERLEEMGGHLPYYAGLLHSEIHLARGEYDKTITLLEKLRPPSIPYMSDTEGMLDYNLPPLRDTLARAFLRKGNPERAIASYEELMAPVSNRRDRQMTHPKYLYRLAWLEDTAGRRDRAKGMLKRFLDIWKDADPDLPEVMHARERV